MNKIIILIIVIVVVGGGFMLFSQPKESTLIPFLDGPIVYTNTGYTPKEIRIAKGDTVVFQNESSRDMWPATAIHPTHTIYPGSSIQKCRTSEAESIFDACGGVKPGQSWSFQFNEAGFWGFHDHLQTRYTGKITVE